MESMTGGAMAKVNFILDEDVQAELNALVPARKRSRVVNEALRRELLRRRREVAHERLKEIRRKIEPMGEREIVEAVRRDRARPQ
jgi:hypothetical protein